jgi:hypothetical protein
MNRGDQQENRGDQQENLTRLSVRRLRETTWLTLPKRDCGSSNSWEIRVVEVTGALQHLMVIRL